MPGLSGKRKLTATQVAKELSTGQSWLHDWMRGISTRMNSYQSRCLWYLKNMAAQSVLSHRIYRFPQEPGKSMWRPRLINQAATEIWRRDLHELVSSLFSALAAETSSNLSYCLVCPAGQMGANGTEKHDYYLCPWNTLHKGIDGRSWAMNNTSNLPGVE